MNQHLPILLPAVVELLRAGQPDVQRLIDGTVGGGGHSQALLRAGPGELLACALDRAALPQARQRLAEYGPRVHFHRGSYLEMRTAARARGWEAVDAILLDLGLSSLQLDDPERGFSFRFDAPLDMRFDTSAGQTASDLLEKLSAAELAQLLFRYGEERHARRIARAIIAQRPITSTVQLAELVSAALPAAVRRRRKIHPATKTFQALRIAVNGELEAVERVIPIAVDLLRPGGRLALLSFHSLEDRIVKRQFRALAETISPPPGMASIGEKRARVKLLGRRPIVPDRAEMRANPRSRSAKLRAVEKLKLA